MNVKMGLYRLTWVLSTTAFLIPNIILLFTVRVHYKSFLLFVGLGMFIAVWLIYFILSWIIGGFKAKENG